MNKRFTLKRTALGLTLTLIILGILFIVLDILDIGEGYRLNWSIAVINTIFISAVALLTIYFTTRNYLQSGSPELLALGGGALAFGFSIVLYGWLPNSELNTRITAYDSGVLLASAVYLAGAFFGMTKQGASGGKSGGNKTSVITIYAAIVIIIAVITWLAYHGIIMVFTHEFSEHFTFREIVQGIAAIFCVSAALIYLRKYRGSRGDIYFWYSLGLILFAAGVIFISRGSLESRIAWLGRVSQYVGGIYLLSAALSASKRPDANEAASNRES
jgi:hypothetical protein